MSGLFVLAVDEDLCLIISLKQVLVTWMDGIITHLLAGPLPKPRPIKVSSDALLSLLKQ